MTNVQSTRDRGLLWEVHVGGTSIGVVTADSAAGTRTFTVPCDGDDASGIFLALDARLGEPVVATRPRNGRPRPEDELAWGTLVHVHLPDWDSAGVKASVRCVVSAERS